MLPLDFVLLVLAAVSESTQLTDGSSSQYDQLCWVGEGFNGRWGSWSCCRQRNHRAWHSK